MASEVGHEGEAPLWAVAAEFGTVAGLVAATRSLREARLGRVDCFTPTPVPEISEALGLHPSLVRTGAVLGSAAGFLAMMGMCLYATILGYRLDVGGRPLVSWPAFMVPSVSFGALTGAVVATLLMLFLNRLPRLNHPAFNIPDFTHATSDRFFLAVEAHAGELDREAVERHLLALAEPPLGLHRVLR